MPAVPCAVSVHFSHVHIYCDRLRQLEDYKQLEVKLNAFAKLSGDAGAEGRNVAEGRQSWLSLSTKHGDPITGAVEPEEYKSCGQDLVEQLLVGLGMRIVGFSKEADTRTLVLTGPDKNGARFVLTAHKDCSLEQLIDASEPAAKRARSEARCDHFDAGHLEQFARYHHGRQGVAILGFAVPTGGIDSIYAKYAELHPKLVRPGGPRTYGGFKLFEVYAYYTGDIRSTDADTGTVLRFIETPEGEADSILPGVQVVEAEFDGVTQAAYCDHWVSNVVSRTGFLETLQETLGFTPKVDFNAGVVAAGEAQIESTVTGNSPNTLLTDKHVALKDQTQVYLPINNALSEVGHVNIFLKELGQGVQHIASRVEDLGALIQRANDYRKMTGAGLSFLQVPMSYYGYLTGNRLVQELGVTDTEAQSCLDALRNAGLVDGKNIVALDTKREAVLAALPEELRRSKIVEHVMRARYSNLYSLLRDNLSEEAYVRIVRNNILVDIQGEDLLLQIFTSKVLQRNEGEEAPFLEFIQRLCSEKSGEDGEPRKMKPGCGGFGIRNFLTLFLSIEVSKASAAKAEADRRGDARAAGFEEQRVDAFTAQLDESNPILTAISDAMTAEGVALEKGDAAEAERWAAEKARGNQALQDVSSKYKEIMRRIREAEEKVSSGM